MKMTGWRAAGKELFMEIKQIAGVAVLAVLAVLGNYFHLPLFFGLDLIFGSVSALVALLLYGRVAGVLVAVAAGVYTYFLWGHPYALLIFTLELALVGWLWQRRRVHLALADALFWLFAGAPLVLLFYGGVLKLNWDTTLVVLFKQMVNGILNALLASFVVQGWRLLRADTRGPHERTGMVTVNALMFNAFLAVGLSAGMASMVLYSHNQADDLHMEAGKSLDAAARRVVRHMEREGVTAQQAIDAVGLDDDIQLAVLSARGEVLARRGELRSRQPGALEGLEEDHPGLRIWLPAGQMAALARWRRGHYVLELPALGASGQRLVIERAAAPAVTRIERGRLYLLGLMSLIALCSVAIAGVLSRWLTQPILALDALSQALPERVMAGQSGVIEGSPVVEFDALRHGLQVMADTVAANFRELDAMRNSLEQQVRERTAELRESRQLLDSIIEHIPVMVFVKRAEDLRFELFNRAGEKMLGYRREQLLGKNDHDFFPPEQAAFFTERDRAVLASGELLDIPEEPVTTASGELRYLHTYKIGLRDAQGRATHLLGISIDITERRAFERERDEFKQTLDRTLDSVLMFDPRELRLFYANEGALGLLGYGREALLRLHLHELIPDTSAHGLRAELAPLQYGERSSRTREIDVRRQDGTLTPVEMFLQYLVAPNTRPRFVAILRDIRERRCAEQALRNSEARLQLAMSATRTSLWDANPLSGRVLLDSRWAELLGQPAHECDLSFQELAALVPAEERDGVQARMRATLRGEAPDYVVEHRVRHADGHWVWVESRGRVVERDADGRATRMIGTNTDISARKRADQLKNEFVSTVSHELRTPLTSISGALGLVIGGALGELPPAMRPMLEIAHTNGQRLAHLINDLLDMEKLAAGKMQFELRTEALMPLVEHALESIRTYGEQYQVSFALTERADGALARVDGGRLQQVLANFLSNAAKFSPPQSRVEVAVRVRDGRARIEVRDHGPGIPAEFRARIFEKFSQADASDTRSKGGTGLGLAISKALMEGMDGSVGFESEVGQGTCFYCELPLQAA